MPVRLPLRVAEVVVMPVAPPVLTEGGATGIAPVVKVKSLPYTVPSPTALARK